MSTRWFVRATGQGDRAESSRLSLVRGADRARATVLAPGIGSQNGERVLRVPRRVRDARVSAIYSRPVARGGKRSGRWSKTVVALPVLVVVTTLGACGTAPSAREAPQADGRLTAPALAWLVDELVDGDASSAEPMTESELGTLGEDSMGVNLRFRPSEGDDGELVQLFVAPWVSRGMREYRSVRACANVRRTAEVTALPGSGDGLPR